MSAILTFVKGLDLRSVEVALVIWYIKKGELLVLFNSVINSTYPDVPKM